MNARRVPEAAVRVRPAAGRDLAAIHVIECASFADPWALDGFLDMIDHPRARLDVAVDDAGVILGYAVAWFVADESEIANLAVAPGARRRGVGAVLLDHVLAVAVSLGVRSIFLEVRESNAAAQQLYAGRQFAVAGRRKAYYRKPVEDALIMRRGL
jgi:ribosomal-protein-alanine N-acetyltransferase